MGNDFMYIMASPACQGIKIDTLALETRVFCYVFPVTTITGGKLLFPVMNGVGLDVADMAACAVDVSPVMRAAQEFDQARIANFLLVAVKAGIDLLLSGRDF